MKFTLRMEIDTKQLDALPLKYRQALGVVVKKAAFDVVARAKTLAPVDTGALKNSIEAKPAGRLTWEVVVGQEYGVYQEFGTTTNRAQPFLGPAVEAVRASFIKATGRVIEAGRAEAAGG